MGTVVALGPTSEFLAGNPAAQRTAVAVITAVFAVIACRVARLGWFCTTTGSSSATSSSLTVCHGRESSA
jgi:hypothetical protein